MMRLTCGAKLQPYRCKRYLIEDINFEILVEETTRKELFSYIDEYLDNLQYEWFDPQDDSFSILYSDGSYDSIDLYYDGHRIKKQNVVSIVYTNASTDIVYGPYEINAYGVVTPAFEMSIDDNIIPLGDK